MIRSDVLKTLVPFISDKLVVTNIGLPSQEMHLIDDQPTNFYMLGTMGLASSIGLGLALAQDKKVLVVDGDGSVLMNFGTLPTIANNPASNYILLIMIMGHMAQQVTRQLTQAKRQAWLKWHALVGVRM